MSILSLDFDHYFEKKKTNETAHNRGAKPRVRTLKKKKEKTNKKKTTHRYKYTSFSGVVFPNRVFRAVLSRGIKGDSCNRRVI